MKVEYMPYYEHLLRSPVLKVLDNSFLRDDAGLEFRLDAVTERLTALHNCNKVYNCLEKIANDSLTFPEEFITEFCDYTQILYDFAKRDSVSEQELLILVRKRDCLVESLFRKNPTETFIGEADWETRILPAVEEVASIRGVKVDYFSRWINRIKNKGFAKNINNDQRIFAKAYVISYERDVLILTEDSDFIRIQKRFYEMEDVLSKKYDFIMPKDNTVDVAFHSNDANIIQIYSADGEIEEVKLQKNAVLE